MTETTGGTEKRIGSERGVVWREWGRVLCAGCDEKSVTYRHVKERVRTA